MAWTFIPLPRGVSTQNPRTLSSDLASHLYGYSLSGDWLHIRNRVSLGTLSPSGTLRSIIEGWVGAVPVQRALALTQTTAYSSSDCATWTSSAESYTSDDSRYAWANPPGRLVYTRTGLNLRYWDGTTFGAQVVVGTNHAARSLINFADRLITAYTTEAGTDYPTRIRWSTTADLTDWSGAGAGTAEIVSLESDPLVGGITLGNRGFMGKERMVYELVRTGDATRPFTIEPRVVGKGIRYRASWASAGEFGFCVGNGTVYRFDGNRMENIGQDIRRIFETGDAPFSITTRYPLLPTTSGSSILAAIHRRNKEYWLMNVESNSDVTAFIFDYQAERWYEATLPSRAIAADTIATEEGIVEFAGTTFYKWDDTTSTDLTGYPQAPLWVTPMLPAQEVGRQGASASPEKKNTLMRVILQGQPSAAVTVRAYANDATSATGEDQITLDSDGIGLTKNFHIPYRYIRIGILPTSTPARGDFLTTGLWVEWQEGGLTL